jgi:hypothetical protein
MTFIQKQRAARVLAELRAELVELVEAGLIDEDGPES